MKLSDWAKQQGITYKTAWRWFKEGKLPVPVEQTATGTILVKAPKKGVEKVALYARVSSADQKSDLDGQVSRLLIFAKERECIMKTTKIFGITISLILVVMCIGFGSSYMKEAGGAPPAEKFDHQVITDVQKSCHEMNQLENGPRFKFENATTTPIITANEAIEIASKDRPDYASNARNIHVEYYNFSKEGDIALTDIAKQKNSLLTNNVISKIPCYIVSFQGITRYLSAPPGMTPPVNHEYNTFIDANTGEILFGFSYR